MPCSKDIVQRKNLQQIYLFIPNFFLGLPHDYHGKKKKEKRVDVSKDKMLLGANVLLSKTLPFADEKF
jgi:hypothetical protein